MVEILLLSQINQNCGGESYGPPLYLRNKGEAIRTHSFHIKRSLRIHYYNSLMPNKYQRLVLFRKWVLWWQRLCLESELKRKCLQVLNFQSKGVNHCLGSRSKVFVHCEGLEPVKLRPFLLLFGEQDRRFDNIIKRNWLSNCKRQQQQLRNYYLI